MSPAIDATSEPRWIHDGVRASQGELRAFFSTGYRFARHPYRFGRAWVEGKEPALNPAAMLATAVGFAVAARVGAIGITMFAGAGPAWFAGMVSMTLVVLHFLVVRPPPAATFTPFSQLSPWQMVSIGMSLAALVAFLATLCAGLTGAHGRRWIGSVLAVAIAVGISGLVFGAIPLAPGRYGPHLAIGTGMALGGTATTGVEFLP